MPVKPVAHILHIVVSLVNCVVLWSTEGGQLKVPGSCSIVFIRLIILDIYIIFSLYSSCGNSTQRLKDKYPHSAIIFAFNCFYIIIIITLGSKGTSWQFIYN